MKSKCILWTGTVNNKGYGQIRIGPRCHLVHRIAFKLANPSVRLGGKLVLHRCDTRRCINGLHLFLGSPQDNTDDMIAKGRGNWATGERANKAKLTLGEVRHIRKHYRPGLGQKLATKYGVTKTAIYDIVNGKSWKGE